MKTTKLFLALAFLFNGFLSAQTDTLMHLGYWEGEDEGEIGNMSLQENGFAAFIYEEETFGGESFELEPGIMASLQYTIDYKTDPMILDFRIVDNKTDETVRTLFGIFKFDENRNMTLCLNFEEEVRPEEYVEDWTIVFKPAKKEKKKKG